MPGSQSEQHGCVCQPICCPFAAASDEWHFELGEQPPPLPLLHCLLAQLSILGIYK